MRQFKFSLFALTLILTWVAPVDAQNVADRRAERNLRQADRQLQRAANRSSFYSDNGWKQVSPWVNQYNLRPIQQAANAASNGVATNGVARFGFANPNVATAAANWFYDYYALPQTYYSPSTASAQSYNAAHRFRDVDGDGVYDGFQSYRDKDNDGKYDEYDQYDFADPTKDDNVDNDEFVDSQRHTITGQIDGIKSAKVNGSAHTIVRLKGDKLSVPVIDLGPVSNLENTKINEGQAIEASGPIMRIGEKEVLVAESAKISGKEIVISRSGQPLAGVILDKLAVDVQNGAHSMVVVKTAEDGNRLVDLGDSNKLKAKLEPQTQIVVWGVPVRMRDQTVLLAERVQLNGQTYEITRW